MHMNHLKYTLLGLATSVSMTKASPVRSTPNIATQLFSRDVTPCDPGALPILYKQYYADSCPPKLLIQENGNCPVENQGNNDCLAFCQVRTYFEYDQEHPVVNNPYCHGPMTCTVSQSKAFAYTYSAGADLKWTKAFTAGITGGFSISQTTTQLRSVSVNLDAGQCGYFTFLPMLRSTCGTMSRGSNSGWPSNTCWPLPPSVPNVCATQAARSEDGSEVLGATVFVKTNCANNERLPMDQQDPAYQQPGVAQPQVAYDQFMSVYSTCSSSNGCNVLQPVDCSNGSCNENPGAPF